MAEREHDRRRESRLALTVVCEAVVDESQQNVQLADISPSGCRFEAASTLAIGTAVLMALHDEFPPVEAEVVWAHEGEHGARFTEPLEPELFQALLVMSRLYGERFATTVHSDDEDER